MVMDMKRKRGSGRGRTMRFRPCIDIHNGKVKQIIGGSLKDEGDFSIFSFVSRLLSWAARKVAWTSSSLPSSFIYPPFRLP